MKRPEETSVLDELTRKRSTLPPAPGTLAYLHAEQNTTAKHNILSSIRINVKMAEVRFNRLQDGTQADFTLMADEYKMLCTPELLTNRVIEMLLAEKGVFGGAKIDLYEHGLQTATRAYENDEDDEAVVCCLLHDIGELLSPSNHGEIPAAILKPYISEKWRWILANHEVFQGFYYYHFVGGDRNKREIYRGNPYYQDMIDFCEKYDAPSFDSNFKSLDLDFFRPMVLRIFSRVPYQGDPGNPKAVAVTGKFA
eukprot:Seg3880.1 transcript_id=Seg3880.1/GoldUCD/mRNA.D3Y31 product="hypothetical protein" protein_id=Seg3880.1/GoldUCD/D3Y31